MSNYLTVCPQLPVNNICPVTEIYVHSTEVVTQEQYSQDLYDIGFEGVLTLFVAGIGTGAIIAIISKLRR